MGPTKAPHPSAADAKTARRVAGAAAHEARLERRRERARDAIQARRHAKNELVFKQWREEARMSRLADHDPELEALSSLTRTHRAAQNRYGTPDGYGKPAMRGVETIGHKGKS